MEAMQVVLVLVPVPSLRAANVYHGACDASAKYTNEQSIMHDISLWLEHPFSSANVLNDEVDDNFSCVIEAPSLHRWRTNFCQRG
eukprot:6477363-Amphidinium_carterae.1